VLFTTFFQRKKRRSVSLLPKKPCFSNPIQMKKTYLSFLMAFCLTSFQFKAPDKPDDTRFTKVTLDDDLNEPMELAIADDGVVYYIERVGYLNSFDPKTNKKRRIAKLNVRASAEDGLLGLALDPNFLRNRWLYLYYGDPTPQQGVYANVLARFTLTTNGLSNRIEMLRVPLLHEGVSHSGGSLTFDNQGHLYLSTGDNTNPFESDGYAPIDDRPGRLAFDALKSSGNTNDFRGKILRIKPQPDGSYTIPEGNLAPPDPRGEATTNTPPLGGGGLVRPEIYVMGCRNPFRIAFDNHTRFLYWGEVGPDAGKDSLMRGPRGHDEVNQARQAGNFGWPLFVGDNKPYHRYDFDKKQSGDAFDPARPVNASRNNTGLRELPAAQKAFIWYPYAESVEFPAMGTGGRNAMAGPVYYYDDYEAFAGKFPLYYDGKLFTYDWMRGKIWTVTMHKNGDYKSMEQFLPQQEFNHPVDMAFNRRGEMYVLEYGTYWRAKNTDAKLVRIEYNEGNRAPVAKITADKTVGAAPLKVQFSAEGSFDHDKGDALRYDWLLGNGATAKGIAPTFTFAKAGVYVCRVRVTDTQGKTAENRLIVRVGNEPPAVNINWQGNRSFYFGETAVEYDTKITDREDKIIDAKRTQVMLHHLPEGEDIAGLVATGELPSKGKNLMAESDCKACHALNNKSVGPSYMQIAQRYEDDALTTLTDKIINGGGGVWTKDHVMSAHPQLLREDAAEMVKYILSLDKPRPRIAPKGQVKLSQNKGSYFLMARYTDSQGLLGQDMLRLRPARFSASEADVFQGVAKKNSNNASTMSYNESGAWIAFKNIDLTGITSLQTDTYTPKLVGNLEVRIGNPTGTLIGTVEIKGKGVELNSTPLVPQQGPQDVYLVYKEISGGIDIWNRLDLRWITLKK
jgi:cytochrome c